MVPLACGVAVTTATTAAGSGAVASSIRYTTEPAGPVILPLRTLNSGRLVEMLPFGSSGVGVSMTTGSTTLKLATVE